MISVVFDSDFVFRDDKISMLICVFPVPNLKSASSSRSYGLNIVRTMSQWCLFAAFISLCSRPLEGTKVGNMKFEKKLNHIM